MTQETMRGQLRALGISPGDVLFVHASMKAIGTPLPPETVLKTLYEAVCPGGTLLLPAFTYETVTPKTPVFDSRESEPCVGLLPRTFFHMPGVVRSIHPTHSVCALGADAVRLTKDHVLDETPVGPHAPLMQLPACGGKLLFIGDILHACTFMHGVEERVGTDYVLTREKIRYIVDGAPRMLYGHDFRGWQQEYPRIRNILGPDALRCGSFGEAPCYLIDAAALLDAASRKLREDMHYFVSRIPDPA